VEGGGVSIINVSSIAGIAGDPKIPLYSMAKGSVLTLTYALAGLFGESASASTRFIPASSR
jgi:NAD(P)-dependent dehydrogenase (short-subunit alcohol dehydrogenase family)